MTTKALVEAALFVAGGPLSLRRLAYALQVPQAEVEQALGDLSRELAREGRGVELCQQGGGYVLRVKPELAEVVRGLAPDQDIPEPTLRTLAVIAYHGPVLQSEVVRVRGQRAYTHIRDLCERGLVAAQEEGPTKRLSVTKELLRYFNVGSQEELRSHLEATLAGD
ncbi:MAG: SMC-Scp complex subunit ScpB [Candidatus Bipolaricaulaceae bacterium]